MKKIEAQIVADSISPQGIRIMTYLLTYPHFIHSELMTHRMFSRNSASSRAIPFEKMVKMVQEDPFIPLVWQKTHKDMQGSEYFTDEEVRVDVGDELEYREDIRLVTDDLKARWLEARDKAVNAASGMNDLGLTKQLCNRLLEPFMWHTVLLTSTEFEDFFNLRCPKYHYEPENKYFRSKKDFLEYAENAFGSHIYIKDEEWRSINSSQAEIHIQTLAEAMFDAMNESTPKELEAGEWHIPFGDRLNFTPDRGYYSGNTYINGILVDNKELRDKLKVATARCARLSYMTFDGEIDYQKDIELHDRLFESKHLSSFEHCARTMTTYEYETFVKGKLMLNHEGCLLETSSDLFGWCNNFRGFIQYRYLIENKF